jgi:hypothetical protein
MFSNEFVPENPLNFHCIKCDYSTCNKKDYTKHVNTIKHKNTENQCLSIQKSQKIPTFECVCGKKYKDYSGLWRHKKKCVFENNEKTDNKIVIINEDPKYFFMYPPGSTE